MILNFFMRVVLILEKKVATMLNSPLPAIFSSEFLCKKPYQENNFKYPYN